MPSPVSDLPNLRFHIIHRDGERRASSASDDRKLKLWGIATGRQFASIRLKDAMRCVTVVPDGVTIFAGDNTGNA